jgi:hypothetical protein
MAREISRTHRGFGGGVWLFNNPDPDQAYNISNMVLEPDGRAYKRNGCQTISSLPAGVEILSFFRWDRPGQSPQLLAHGSDGKLYYTTNLTSWTESGAGAVFSTTNPVCFAVAPGGSPAVTSVYCADGVSAVRKWNGTALTAVTGAPVGVRWLATWKDTLFALAISSNQDRLWESQPGDADTWDATKWVDIGKGDGDTATALFTASQELVVSKRKRTFVVISPVTLENRVADFQKGCETQFSVMKFDADIYYITRFGVAQYVSGAPAEIVSGNIQLIFTGVFLNLEKLDMARGYRYSHRIGWSVVRSGQNYPDFEIEYYPQFPKRPWTFHRIPARAWVQWRDVGDRTYFARNATNEMAQAFAYNVRTDFDQFFQGKIETLWDDLGDPINRKYLRKMRLWGEGHIHVQIRRDRRDPVSKPMTATLQLREPPNWGEPGDLWDPINDVWGRSGPVGTDTVWPDLYGRQFSVMLFDLLDQPPEIENVEGTRRIADFIYPHPHGWSLLQMTLECVQMGELG